jgi:hypothetical protein
MTRTAGYSATVDLPDKTSSSNSLVADNLYVKQFTATRLFICCLQRLEGSPIKNSCAQPQDRPVLATPESKIDS